jgi:hypothetical protein
MNSLITARTADRRLYAREEPALVPFRFVRRTWHSRKKPGSPAIELSRDAMRIIK